MPDFECDFNGSCELRAGAGKFALIGVEADATPGDVLFSPLPPKPTPPEVARCLAAFFVQLASLARRDPKLAALMEYYPILIRRSGKILWDSRREAEGP